MDSRTVPPPLPLARVILNEPPILFQGRASISAMRATDVALHARRAYHGWFIIIILFLYAALTIGSSIYAFGLFIELLQISFGWQRTAITASLSFMTVISVATPYPRPDDGPPRDQTGDGNLRLPYLGSVFSCAR